MATKTAKKSKQPKTFQCGKCRREGVTYAFGFSSADGKTKLCGNCLPYFPGWKRLTDEEIPAPKAPRRGPRPEKADMPWYVLQVEPGCEGRVRKELLKQVRINYLEKHVGRVFSPKMLSDEVLKVRGKTLAEGSAHHKGDAFHAAKIAAARQEEETGQGVVYNVFPDDKKGWRWKVRIADGGTKRMVIKRKKYPGYLLCQMDYVPDLELIVTKKLRNSWGLLLPPVLNDLKVQVTPSKRRGWNWKVREPESNGILEKGSAPAKALAYERANAARAKLEEFKPTALQSKEAAEQLIAQKAVNEISRDRKELNRAVINFRVGDLCPVKHGAMTGAVVRVKAIDKTDKTDVNVDCALELFGKEIPVRFKWWELESPAGRNGAGKPAGRKPARKHA